MSRVYLAEFQVRLLLCTAARKERTGSPGRHQERLIWECGCSAVECAHRKYQVTPCTYHEPLFAAVREDDEDSHDAQADAGLWPIPGIRVRGGCVFR